MRYAIIGTGAIGGYYGACLQRGGAEVHYLLHRDYNHVAHQGLVIKSVAGDFTLPQVKAYATTAAMPPVDVVIIALKTTQNHQLPELVAPLLGPTTALLTLQNGFAIEDELATWAGDRAILGGLCFICSNKVSPGTIHHLDYGHVLLGQHYPDQQPQPRSPLLSQVTADFQAANLAVDTTPDLRLARWRKLVWNIPFNGLSVVLNATTQTMITDPNTRQLAQQLMTEVVEAAHSDGERLSPGQGRHLPPALVTEMLSNTERMAPYRTSMKIDYDEGRPLEIDAIFDNPLRAAQLAGLTLPRIKMLYHQLKALDRQNRHHPDPQAS
jgi:2-dehydropantoate 2-reductase